MSVVVAPQTQVESDHPALLQLHYCDACTAARASFRIWVDRYRVNPDGSTQSLDIVLCGHHYGKHRAAIEEEGYEVEDL